MRQHADGWNPSACWLKCLSSRSTFWLDRVSIFPYRKMAAANGASVNNGNMEGSGNQAAGPFGMGQAPGVRMGEVPCWLLCNREFSQSATA